MGMQNWLVLATLASASHWGETQSISCNPHSQINATRVLVEGDTVNSPAYNEARLDQYYRYWGTAAAASAKLRPAVLVYCSAETHVQSAIRFAGQCGYKVTVRSGGHSYTGSSSCNFANCMQLDLSAMNKTTVQGASVFTEPGIRLVDFATVTLKSGLSVPHGGCGTVGVGGHFQSSAWGMMSHSHGSGLDRVSSFRMVLANGSILVASRNDANATVYQAVLGSAPGSWGVITQYTLDGVRDLECPFTRMIVITMVYSKASFLAAFRQTQFIVKDQEARNLRDLKILLVTAPPTEAGDDTVVYIKAYALWTGIDSGALSAEWHDLYLQPFYALPHKSLPNTFNVPMPLSLATRLFADRWTNHGDRYAVQAFHSDHWWDDEFIELMATEIDERVAMIPDVYPSFQFLPLGANSQWARNAGMNSLTWRDARAYVDDWMFVKNESAYAAVEARMRNFREKTRKYWQYQDGSERQTWMSPMTTYDKSTNLRNATIARQFFPDQSQFKHLQLVKAQLDPHDMFSNMGTIPLPSH